MRTGSTLFGFAKALLAAALVMCAGNDAAILAQEITPTPLPVNDAQLGIASFPLWEGAPPDATADTTRPTLTVFLPQPGKGNGTAVIVAPGGAYLGLAINLEGRQVADWFASRGVTAFVLQYRLGAKNIYPVPLHDAQRAVRLVRSLTTNYHLSPAKIGMIGFSAGGHLAAMTGTSFDDGNASASDPVERVSDRPDFLVLGYPWLNAMQPNDRKLITYCSLIKTVSATDCKLFEEKYTPSLHVTAQTPTTFIYATTDDALVPVSASVDFFNALSKAGVPAELHIFRHGNHGTGLGESDPALTAWPNLLEQWLRAQGFLDKGPAASTAK
jgi:acetyl esterase/lipase